MELDRLLAAKSLSKNAVLCLAGTLLVFSGFLYSRMKIGLASPFKLSVWVLTALHTRCVSER